MKPNNTNAMRRRDVVNAGELMTILLASTLYLLINMNVAHGQSNADIQGQNTA